MVDKKLKALKKTITDTKLSENVKNNLLSRINNYTSYDDFIEEYIDDNALIFDLDFCLDLYKELTGESAFDANYNEKDNVETTIKKYFKDNLDNFPYNIMTEDYITIYNKK